MKIRTIHSLRGKGKKVIEPGTEIDSKELGLSDEQAKDLSARGAVELVAQRAKPEAEK